MIEYYKNLNLESLPYINEEGLVCLEEFIDIPGYEYLYQVSDLGRIKSYDRSSIHENGNIHCKKSKILKQANNGKDYLSVLLYDYNSVKKSYYVHRLLLKTFVGESDLLVDHKNHIRLCNTLLNLRYLTPRLNSSTTVNRPTPASKYVGVDRSRNSIKKWRAVLRINGIKRHIGTYITEEEASEAYQNALYNWDNFSLTPKGVYEEKNKVKIFNTKSGENLGVNAKIVLDTDTGIFYDSLKEACNRLNLKYKHTSNLLCKGFF
jgi:hypothetical protein